MIKNIYNDKKYNKNYFNNNDYNYFNKLYF